MATPDDGRALLLALAAGELPLGVYADWLEESGHQNAGGVRWLAGHDKFPANVDDQWTWHNVFSPFVVANTSILPYDVWERANESHTMIESALDDASTALRLSGRLQSAPRTEDN